MTDVKSAVSAKDLQAQIDALRAENARLQAEATAPRTLTLKVSAKGAVSVYGMGRFPVTLYASQWDTLLNMSSQIKDFIKSNSGKLASKRAATAA